MTLNSSANSVILIVFAFLDNLSAENYKLSAGSGLQGLSLLGCMGPMGTRAHGPMDQWTDGPLDHWTTGPMDQRTNGPKVQCRLLFFYK